MAFDDVSCWLSCNDDTTNQLLSQLNNCHCLNVLDCDNQRSSCQLQLLRKVDCVKFYSVNKLIKSSIN